MSSKLGNKIKGYHHDSKEIKLKQLYQIDFGFVRNSSSPATSSDNKLTTCWNGYNCYLLITDYATRYSWVFLTASKEPPTVIMEEFLTKFGVPNGIIRTDKGVELSRSIEFRRILRKHHYGLESTTPSSSF